MTFYSRESDIDLRGLAGLQWLGIGGMVIDHFTRGLQVRGGWWVLLGLFGFTLPVMCFCVGLFSRVTKNLWLYLWRLFVLGVLSQIPYIWSGVGGESLNDVLGLCLGLCCVMIEEKYKWLGLPLCLIMGFRVGLGFHVLMVWLAWFYEGDQELYVMGVVVLGLCLMWFDVRFLAWVIGGVVLVGGSVRAICLPKLGRLMYFVYGGHLVALGALKGVLG
jgi:hypothetical protein